MSETEIHVSPLGFLDTHSFGDNETLYDIFQSSCEKFGPRNCLGEIKADNVGYSWLSYSEVNEKSLALGSAFENFANSNAVEKRHIALYSSNCTEFDLTLLACYGYSFTPIPLYDSLGLNGLTHILEQTKASIVLAGDEKRAQNLLKIGLQTIKLIVSSIELSDETIDQIESAGIHYSSFTDFEKNGKNINSTPRPVRKEDPGVIMYTSGTTGVPKGVVLSHESFLHTISSFRKVGTGSKYILHMNEYDVFFSYLPSAHIFNFISTFWLLAQGASIGYLYKGIQNFSYCCKLLQPTCLVAVPRVLNKVYERVWTLAKKSCWKNLLLQTAYRSKRNKLLKGQILGENCFERTVFKQIKEQMGGRVRGVICGGAPIGDDVLTFMRCALDALIIVVYSQTECGGAGTCTPVQDNSVNNCGLPLPCCEYKLVDVPDLSYFARDNKGEICIRSPSNFLGYYQAEELTRGVIDEDNWVHTGDIGEWLESGALRIIDRKKNLFKLAQGEYIAPEKVEITYMENPMIAQCYVYGNSLQTYAVGILVLNEEILIKKCKEHNIDGKPENLCEKTEVQNIILHMLKQGTKNSLNSLEQVKKVHCTIEPFTVENGLLTPTLKIRREAVNLKYKDQIEAMYL